MDKQKYLTSLLSLFAILFAGCGLRFKTLGNGEGFGGGDPDLGPLEVARQSLIQTMTLVQNGSNLASLCKIHSCPTGMDSLVCKTLYNLTQSERQYCASFITQQATPVITLHTQNPIVSFQLEDSLSVVGPDGNPMSVLAMTAFGPSGPIEVTRDAVQSLSAQSLLALVTHESGHKVPLSDASYVTDNDPIGPFTEPGGGRMMLDTVGAALAFYHFNYNSASSQPAGRYGASVVWTGATGNPATENRALVYGGSDGQSVLNSGFIYDPLTHSITIMSAVNAPSARMFHAAFWTGQKMLVWGGNNGNLLLGDGAVYDPATDRWTSINLSGAPWGRSSLSGTGTDDETAATPFAVWTGSQMIVWGGWRSNGTTNTGGIYDPLLDQWQTLPTDGAPSERASQTMVWTGSQLLVWGGTSDGTDVLGDGALFDPVASSWTPMAFSTQVAARKGAAGVWTGTDMILWGGTYSQTSKMNDGFLYDPIADNWTQIKNAPLPCRTKGPAVVWTGNQMIVWSGGFGGNFYNAGATYDPSTNTWTAMTYPSWSNPPTPRAAAAAVWTGQTDDPSTTNLFFVWGGETLPNRNAAMGIYSFPQSAWLPTP